MIQNDISASNDNGCLSCHPKSKRGFNSGHGFGSTDCTICHGGDPAALNETKAHDGLIAFPGNLENSKQVCGNCHTGEVNGILQSPMTTGRGIISRVHALFSEKEPQPASYDSLNTTNIAGSLIRKLCASCHLGHNKVDHEINVTHDRGGGCLACHINEYSEDSHPTLSSKVDDGRCFGCHARSSRISLNYVGLAEVEEVALKEDDVSGLSRLDDGRLLTQKEADVHYLAGMSCIDCHTSRGIMNVDNPGNGVDIDCLDCHDPKSESIDLHEWPQSRKRDLSRLSYPIREGQSFAVSRRLRTLLWHIELRAGQRFLYPKMGGAPLEIPLWNERSHSDGHHSRLACNACHSQWAPRCNGCHTQFNENYEQWDHNLQQMTTGRWQETRWDIFADKPTLGVDERNRIRAVVPGMIMTVDHPELTSTLFSRRFAAVSPHTTGPSRSCRSCHDSSQTLGLGRGVLIKHSGKNGEPIWSFTAHADMQADGLPTDAWTSLEEGGLKQKDDPPVGMWSSVRPLNESEMYRILNAPITTMRDQYGH